MTTSEGWATDVRPPGDDDIDTYPKSATEFGARSTLPSALTGSQPGR